MPDTLQSLLHFDSEKENNLQRISQMTKTNLAEKRKVKTKRRKMKRRKI